jgi:hypothetical protein
VTVGNQRAIGGMGARAGTPSSTGWAPLAESRHLSQAQVLTGLPRRILDTVRPKCSSQAPAFGKWQHTRFLTQSAAVDTPVSAVNLTLNHSTTDPHMCVADPGRQTHLTFWLWREAGLRLSLLLASSSITCSWTMGTAEVALPIGSLLDESPPPEVIH